MKPSIEMKRAELIFKLHNQIDRLEKENQILKGRIEKIQDRNERLEDTVHMMEDAA